MIWHRHRLGAGRARNVITSSPVPDPLEQQDGVIGSSKRRKRFRWRIAPVEIANITEKASHAK